LVLYDVAHDDVVKEIVLEKVDRGRHGDLRWHPAMLVEEVGDWNGDGTSEVAVVTAFGKTAEEKEFRLMVVDVQAEETIADFAKTGSELIEVGDGKELGMVGTGGEFYLLNVANELRITSPAAGTRHTSPLRVQWTGVGRGAFTQLFVDGVEVARTNEDEVTLTAAQGSHQLTVRSVDEHGRGVYRSVNFSVEKNPFSAIWAIVPLVVLGAIALWLPVSRLVAAYRRGRRSRG